VSDDTGTSVEQLHDDGDVVLIRPPALESVFQAAVMPPALALAARLPRPPRS